MQDAIKFEFTVKKEDVDKAKKIFEENKDIFLRVIWSESKVKLIGKI